MYDCVSGLPLQQIEVSEKFKTEMKVFLANYKKKFATAKQKGEVTEQASEKLSSGVYRFLSLQAIKDGNSFLWAWLTMQWNLMCRSINVQTILLEHFNVDGDAFTEKFFKTKSGQGGEQSYGKHVYANPLTPEICPILSFAVHAMATAVRPKDDRHFFQGL